MSLINIVKYELPRIEFIISELAVRDLYIDIFDGEEFAARKVSASDRREVLKHVFDTDETTFKVYAKSGDSYEYQGFFLFIHDNGRDVVSDYSASYPIEEIGDQATEDSFDIRYSVLEICENGLPAWVPMLNESCHRLTTDEWPGSTSSNKGWLDFADGHMIVKSVRNCNTVEDWPAMKARALTELQSHLEEKAEGYTGNINDYVIYLHEGADQMTFDTFCVARQTGNNSGPAEILARHRQEKPLAVAYVLTDALELDGQKLGTYSVHVAKPKQRRVSIEKLTVRSNDLKHGRVHGAKSTSAERGTAADVVWCGDNPYLYHKHFEVSYDTGHVVRYSKPFLKAYVVYDTELLMVTDAADKVTNLRSSNPKHERWLGLNAECDTYFPVAGEGLPITRK